MADLLHRVMMKASTEKVFNAITLKKGLQSWWTPDVEVDNSSKNYNFGFGGGKIYLRMKVLKLVPWRYVEWLCYGDNVQWRTPS